MDGNILIKDETQENTENFIYKGGLYAFPVGEDVTCDDFKIIELNRLAETENIFSIPTEFQYRELIVFSGPEVRRRIIPKYYNRVEFDFDKSERSSRSADVIQFWYEKLLSEDIMGGEHWRILSRAFDICSKNNLPFTTFNGFKSVAKTPELLAKFIISMWINEYKDVLSQEIDRFEQEMEVALHWIPAKIWNKCIDEFIQNVPEVIQLMILQRVYQLVALLKDLFSSTVSTDIADEFSAYLVSGNIEVEKPFLTSDINNYKMKIQGMYDLNYYLPNVKFELRSEERRVGKEC